MGNKPLQIAVASVAWVAALVTANAWVAPMKGAATVLQLNASNLSYYASSVFLSASTLVDVSVTGAFALAIFLITRKKQ